MKKRVLVLVLLSLVLVSMISSFVLAVDPEPVSKQVPQYNPDIDQGVGARSSTLCLKLGWENPEDAMLGDQNWFCKALAQWETGVNWENENDVAWAATFMKYFLLILIIILIWSGMSYADFPKNVIFKIVLAVIAGFLFTFLISGSEIITAMTSFSAAGLALIIFFPLFVLAIFTLLVAAKADPFGIFVQKILWIIYGVYLVFRAGSLMLFKFYADANKANDSGFLKFFLGDPSSFAYAQYTSPAVVTTLLVVGIAVLAIMGFGNDPIRQWIGSEKRKAELEAWKAKLSRSKNFVDTTAEQLEEGSKKPK